MNLRTLNPLPFDEAGGQAHEQILKMAEALLEDPELLTLTAFERLKILETAQEATFREAGLPGFSVSARPKDPLRAGGFSGRLPRRVERKDRD
jgi:hypothetical protein